MNKDKLPIENNSRHPRVLVFGGLNMGLITKVTRMPEEGETIRGNEFYASSGGKGATQAVAASRNLDFFAYTVHLPENWEPGKNDPKKPKVKVKQDIIDPDIINAFKYWK